MKNIDIGLYSHQLEVIPRIHNGSIVCGNMGSGKSRVGIGYYFTTQGGSIKPYREMKNPCDLFIITTAQKRDKLEWEVDMIPFLLSSDSEVNHYNNKVTVDSWNNITKYKTVRDSFFIFDEQRLVGSGVWVKTFYKIAEKNQWILLTATPGDSWEDYIPVFIANGFYRTKTEFLSRHAVYSRYSKYPKITKWIEQGRLMKLRNQITVNINYVHEISKHSEEIITEYDKDLYKRVMTDRWDVYEDVPIENPSKLFYLMRKVVNNDSSRYAAVQYLSAKYKKLIVFYNFDYELENLKNIIYPEGTKIAEWNGHHHEKIPKSDRWIYLVNYAAGSEGWNCTETNVIVFFSQNYSYKTMVQASGRIDRLNTPFNDLYYYYLRSKSPIDMAILKALKRKENFNESSFNF